VKSGLDEVKLEGCSFPSPLLSPLDPVCESGLDGRD
jgi:hypothetical protein